MKKFVLALILIAIGCGLHFGSGYGVQRPTPVTVVNKLIIPGGYKSSGHAEMVLQLDNGYTFDTIVSATTYSVCTIGSRYVMELSPMEIRQTMWQNALFFFGPLLFWSFGGMGLFVAMFSIKQLRS